MGILILKLFLVYAVIVKTDGSAINAFTVANEAVNLVHSGYSMLKDFKAAFSYSVWCKIEVENWTKYQLVDPSSSINFGVIEYPPVIVQPAEREVIVGHKSAYTTAGTTGTASWVIKGMSKRVVVMWSCPYNFDFHSNWLAVGLTTTGTAHQDWYNQMYYGKSDNSLNFVRGQYYRDTIPIAVNDTRFEVAGTMGTSHQATARIIVRPILQTNDLASGFGQHYMR